MEATRQRFTSFLEWAVAVACLLALLGVGSIVTREVRTVSAALTVNAREATPIPSTVPAGVPPRAISVPMLLLSDGKEVRVGETISAILEKLGQHALTGKQAIERAVHGQRVTRFYDYVGTQFVLVFEPFEYNAEPRVAAIYLQ